MAKEAITQGEIDARLSELEKKMNRLRTLYEQYFMGIERVPPTVLAKDVFRLVQRLENTFIRNTAQKFRLRSLVQRYNSYKVYWRRIEKQIENGTHSRDLKRAKRNSERREAREQRQDDGMPFLELDLEEIQDLSDYQKELEQMDAAGQFDAAAPRASAPQAAAPASQANAQSAAELKAQKLDLIRRQLMGQAQGTPQVGTPPAHPEPARPAAAAKPGPAGDDRSSKLDSLRQRFQARATQGAAPLPTGGANVDKLRELAAHKQRLQAQKPAAPAPSQPRTVQRNSSSQRVIQRTNTANPASKDQARDVYNKLIEAKKSCRESTSGLTYESVKRSMTQQTDHLRKSRGANDVDFKVVIKDGKAFLKPVPK